MTSYLFMYTRDDVIIDDNEVTIHGKLQWKQNKRILIETDAKKRE